MKTTVQVEFHWRIEQAKAEAEAMIRDGLRDTIVAIHRDVVEGSRVQYGTNRRSISSEVSGMGLVAGSSPEKIVDDTKLEAACYSTSGYGGYLEVGTGLYGPLHEVIRPKVAKALSWLNKAGERVFAAYSRGVQPIPYFRPALDRHWHDLPANIRKYVDQAKGGK
jgi:hypothetical protein